MSLHKRIYTVSDFPGLKAAILVIADNRPQAKRMVEDILVRQGFHLTYCGQPNPYTLREHDLSSSYVEVLGKEPVYG